MSAALLHLSALHSPPLLHRSHFSVQPNPLLRHRLRRRGKLMVTRLVFLDSGHFPDSETLQILLTRAEGLLYTIADAAVAGSDAVTEATTTTTSKESGDWFSGITYYMETVLKVLKDGLSTLHVPNSYGFAIILLTVLVKAATFPLTKKQVESAMAMRSLQPQIKAIQQRYAGDQEKIQLETARLYKLAGINPLAGCLPTLATIPVWIGLYRALSNVANEGLLSEGFFWIPSLAGPTTVASRQNGTGISWLFPFIDGHPPLGWPDTLSYLVLPVLFTVSQYASIRIMQPKTDDPNLNSSQAITKILPLMIGYFALSVPSGLSLYWLTNNILSTAQQVWLQKLGGASNPLQKINEINDNILKEELAQVSQKQSSISELKSATAVENQSYTGELNSISEFNSTKTVESQSSTGLRPGERFKQIKEEEARKRREREEAKQKAEEAAKATQVTVEAANDSTVGFKGEANGKDQQASTASSSLDHELVNENVSSAASENRTVSINANSRTSTSDSEKDTVP
ncbi:ALBINO3-like protein [Drosera capensis]